MLAALDGYTGAALKYSVQIVLLSNRIRTAFKTTESVYNPFGLRKVFA